MPQDFSNVDVGHSTTATELLTLKEFGAKIKTQYPQYSKYGDEEIGTRMLAKYPQYQANIKPFISGENDTRNMPAGSILPQRLLDLVPALNMARIATAKPSIMSEHAASVLRGVADTPSVLKAGITEAAQTPFLPPALQAILGGYAAFQQVKPYEATARQAVELASPGTVNAPTPDSPEAFAASRQAGTNLAMTELPNVASGLALATKAGVTGLGRLIQKGVINAPIVNKWMGIPEKWVRHGANPAQQLIQDKLLAGTKEATLAKVQPELNAVGKALDAKLKAGTARGILIDGEDIFQQAMNDASKSARGSETAFQNSVMSVLNNAYREFPDLKALTPERAHQFKVWIGDSTKFETVPSVVDAQLNDMLMDIYGNTNNAIKTNVGGGIEADLRRWGNLYQAQKALKTGIGKDIVGQGTGSLRGVVAKRIAKGAAIAGTGTYVANKMRAVLD